MIIIFTSSRLGNQLFQYSFAITLRENKEKIYFFGFNDLFNTFDNLIGKDYSTKNRFNKYLVFKILKPTLKLLSNLRIITLIETNREYISSKVRESDTFRVSKGIFNSIRYIHGGYYQSQKFFSEKLINGIKIKKNYLVKAKDFLTDIPTKFELVFVHIRRGDYENFKVWGKNILLPVEYYKVAMEFINSKLNGKAFYIFLSDNPEYVKKEFYYLKNKKISINNHFATDLAIMSLCKHGILSISTFSWWGAYLIKNKGLILAPKYWLGINDKIEAPKNIFPTFATPVEINNHDIKILEKE